jgi:trehalose 6-phosphate phosphatase
MRHALSPDSIGELKRFLAAGAVLAFDFDGTLAPIVRDPDMACMRPNTRLLLCRVARVHPCLVISGRSLAGLQRKFEGTGIDRLIGNHGAEPWPEADRIRTEVSIWERTLAAQLPALEGLWIENKGLSLTVHYRVCKRKTAARIAIREAARLLPGIRLVGGKQAVSFVSERAPNKGTALEALLIESGCRRALYVGDDDTDEDVFAICGGPLSLFTIRVGRKSRSAAAHFLRGQSEIDKLLRVLLDSVNGLPASPSLRPPAGLLSA